MGIEVTTTFGISTVCLGASFDGFISVVKIIKITHKNYQYMHNYCTKVYSCKM